MFASSRADELALGWATAAVGAMLLSTPARVSDTVAGTGAGPALAIVRLLGGRYAAQGAAQLLLPRRTTFVAGAGVDALHALSMIALGAAVPRYRRPAACSFVLATLSSAAGLAVSPRRH